MHVHQRFRVTRSLAPALVVMLAVVFAAPAPPPPAHPAPAMAKADDIYAAQVVADESMADGAARWLAGGGQRLLILAGNGHCHDSAVVRRLQRRGVASVLSVRPIVDDGDGNVATAVAEAINDYLFRLAIEPSYFTFDDASGKLLSLDGRVPPKVHVGAWWRDLDAHVVYDYVAAVYR